jgi:HEAT repeat protein
MTLVSVRVPLVVAVLLAGWCGVARAGDGRTDKERQLIVQLRTAAEGEKAIACKQLAIHGSADAVPDVAKLLGDERLSSWARIALEAIPDPACDAALREAAGRLQGRLLVGVINSLGVRRDAGAVGMLAGRLADPDPAVASAAAIALGQVGDVAALAALRPTLAATQPAVRDAVAEASVVAALAAGPTLAATQPAVRDAVAEACVVAAERMRSAGRGSDAAALCDLVCKAEVSAQRIGEATRGAILARGAAGVPRLIELLRSPDRRMFGFGLSVARELQAPEVDAALIAEIAAAPARAALFVEALADRGGATARKALAEVAARADAERTSRLAAVRALGRIGDDASLPTLLALASDADRDLAAAARTAIADLPPSAGVDDAVRGRLASASPAALPVLLEIVSRRRISAALPEVLGVVKNADKGVQAAAVAALGEIVDLDRLGILVDRSVGGDDAAGGLAALRTACVRMPDRDACVQKLEGALGTAAPATRLALLDIVGEVGGKRALAAVAAAARTADQEPIQDAGTRLLGKWATADAAPVLLDLVKTIPEGKYRDRALKGYLRVARQLAADEAQRIEMCRTALAAARNDADRGIIAEAIKGMPNAAAVQKAVESKP